MTQQPPLVMAKLWKSVMSKARGRCQCRGDCGNKHTASRGRCDTTNAHIGKPPLIAAPVDLALALGKTGPPADSELMAWCQLCYTKALGKARKTARAEPTADVPLFDLP